MSKFLQYSLLLFSLVVLPLLAAEESAPTLDETTIVAEQDDPLTSVNGAYDKIAATPGSASLVTENQWFGRGVRDSDLFALNPSVSAEANSIGNESRITIRGSGSQSDRGNRGITILQDGIKGSGVEGTFSTLINDPFTLQFVEVYPGANGFAQGSNQLGGAINYVLKNGLNSPGGSLQTDYGSFDTVRAAIQYGESEGKWDYFGSFSHSQSNGYRDQQQWDNDYLLANIAYHWSESASTRFYFNALNSTADIAGNLTKSQFETDPTQRQFGFDDASKRESSLYRFSQKTTWSVAEDEYMLYAYYHHFDNDAYVQINAASPIIDSSNLDLDESGVGLRNKNHWNAFGLEQVTRGFISYDYGDYGYKSQQGPMQTDQLDKSDNFQVYMENKSLIAENHHAFIGLGWIYSRRNSDDQLKLPTTHDYKNNQDGGIWRAGYLYDITSDSQVFANISQSFEAPSFPSINNSIEVLDPQKALTYELGSRFQHNWIKGSLTGYFSDVKDEFISYELIPNTGIYRFSNEDTTHKGLEAYLGADLNDAFSLKTSYMLDAEASYQLNDFTFDEGANSGKQLPGISPHVYAGKLRLTEPQGKWNTSLSARYLPEGLQANNANTLSSDGFAVFQWAAEWIFNDNLSLYGGIDNLFDKSYANQVAINPISPAYISPGDGRSYYFGARLHW